MGSPSNNRTAAALFAIGLVAGACSSPTPSSTPAAPPSEPSPSHAPQAIPGSADATPADSPTGAVTKMWTATGAYLEEREGESSTLLPNGTVLVAGGESEQLSRPVRRTAELYDPKTGTWTRTGPMHVARVGHAALLQKNGEVLVIGGDARVGRHTATLSSAELYDPTTLMWTEVPPMAQARSLATATLLPDGRVLVAGGTNYATGGPLRTAEIYDPVARQWTRAADMEVARAMHTATLLPNGKVLVTSGGCCGDPALASAELYDPDGGTWAPTAPLAAARRHASATLLNDGKVLVYGGDNLGIAQLTAELYDVETGSWVATSSAPKDGPATRLADGRLFVMGWETTPEIYEPATGSWTIIQPPIAGLRAFIWGPPPPTLLADGRVFVPDGPEAFVFDPAGKP